MVSGIGRNNSLYGYQANLNQLRLTNALSTRYSAQPYPASAVKPVFGVTSATSSATSDSITYVKNYSSSMTDLMSSANALRNVNSSSVSNKLAVSSSDTSVLEADSKKKLYSSASYDINVSQLATAQVNRSSDTVSTDAAVNDVLMNISGSKNSAQISISASKKDGTQKTNAELLSETAAAINKADTGVSASVITKNGKSHLELTSQKTGSDNGFSVSGDFAEQSSLDTVSQQAQDAAYTVKEGNYTRDYTSSSNNIQLGYGKISATLKKEGSASVNIAADSSGIASAMETFVKDYNSAVSLLTKNADRGSGTIHQAEKLLRVPGSSQRMEMLGLSTASDGTLSLDKETLIKNLKEKPDLTKNMISGNSGIAQSAFSSASSALKAPVSGLIQNDLQESAYSQLTNSNTFLSTYSKSGAYNMSNLYSLGMMFNMYV